MQRPFVHTDISLLDAWLRPRRPTTTAVVADAAFQGRRNYVTCLQQMSALCHIER